MISTTTNAIEGREVAEYKGIVFGEVVAGVNFLKDIGAGIRNVFGGRSSGYEKELLAARDDALREMEQRAAEMVADAILSVDIDYEVLGTNNDMLMVTSCGTADSISVREKGAKKRYKKNAKYVIRYSPK